MKFKALFGLLAAGLMATSAAKATELEVTHWRTSGGEAAAEFARRSMQQVTRGLMEQLRVQVVLPARS